MTNDNNRHAVDPATLEAGGTVTYEYTIGGKVDTITGVLYHPASSSDDRLDTATYVVRRDDGTVPYDLTITAYEPPKKPWLPGEFRIDREGDLWVMLPDGTGYPLRGPGSEVELVETHYGPLRPVEVEASGE